MLAERYSDLHVTLFDLPGVLDVAREIQSASPVAGKLEYHPGDYHSDDLPRGFDAVLYCGALHQESRDSAAKVMRSALDALEPGGTFFLVDFLLDDDRAQPVFAALFALNMKLIQPHGGVYTATEAMDLVREAGFEEVQLVEVAQSPYRIVWARKLVA
jgi:SAM-dependent methyltransferase